uniref:Uncharacterized protein n=1 Tax=Arundo donax TaxID=35708 RepID=A0A0A9GE56_ARUDO
MVLEKYFPEVSRLSPSIGRQGKALRRQRLRKVMESHMAMEKTDDFSCSTLKEQNMNTDDVDSVIYGVDTGSGDIHHDEYQKFNLFKDFTMSGLGCLGCGSVEDVSLLEIWKDVQLFTEYIGPFWCLWAALGPLVETYILLNRLLFLQEQGNLVESLLFPLFDPTMSPRNMAVIAWKLSKNPSEA